MKDSPGRFDCGRSGATVANRSRRMRRSLLLAVLPALGVALASGLARADDPPVPPATELPQMLTLDEAVRTFRARGLDLLIAEANVRNAEGQVKIAGAVPNPTVSASVGNGLTYGNNAFSQSSCLQNGAQCSPWIYNVGLSDSAALEDTLSGKRDLRQKVARNALAAAKMSRVDAQRIIEFQVKSAYLQVAQAVLGVQFADKVKKSNEKTQEKFRSKYAAGAINEGDLARIDTQKLESDQAYDTAVSTARQARVALAFLLGVRGEVHDFAVETKALDYQEPGGLRNATEAGLLRIGFDHRPDLISLGYQRASSAAQIELVRRQRFPDIALDVNYAWGGFGGQSTNGPLQAPTITFGISAPIPIFYQLEGELRQARAQYDTNSLLEAKATAQVVNDVSTAYSAYDAAHKLVLRMLRPDAPDQALLQRAKTALEKTELQYDRGQASLTDYLDALRTYIATQVEDYQDRTNYWTAVFQIEEAVGMELH